uniref:Uncharacterized protein AlNc14C23G2312 n=1 Tax=Albugo laibachii Nc14 TaxID=890382 RepID=F0W607_9STRA|nr:conserved hypothetical protein [Albugo laibachii Nc14]|eukprot:CCA16549.1 conserved hypothetical protein [Albugo laibachii Nc14]
MYALKYVKVGMNKSNMSAGQSSSIEKMQADLQKQKEQEEMRNSILQQVMLPEARERLSRIGIVKPEKAREVGDCILQMAQKGQIPQMISEERLIQLLNSLGERDEKHRMKITVKRRRAFSDEEEENDSDF